MQRLRAFASWMTTGAVTLALALTVVVSGQLTKSQSLATNPVGSTIVVRHRPAVVVNHKVGQPARAKLVDTSSQNRLPTVHKAPVRPTDSATTTVAPTTTTSTTTTTTSTTTTSTTTTTTTLPPVTTSTHPHHHGDGGGDGSGGGSDDPPGSD